MEKERKDWDQETELWAFQKLAFIFPTFSPIFFLLTVKLSGPYFKPSGTPKTPFLPPVTNLETQLTFNRGYSRDSVRDTHEQCRKEPQYMVSGSQERDSEIHYVPPPSNQSHYSLSSAFCLVGFGAMDWSQGLMHTRQGLYHWVTSSVRQSDYLKLPLLFLVRGPVYNLISNIICHFGWFFLIYNCVSCLKSGNKILSSHVHLENKSRSLQDALSQVIKPFTLL